MARRWPRCWPPRPATPSHHAGAELLGRLDIRFSTVYADDVDSTAAVRARAGEKPTTEPARDRIVEAPPLLGCGQQLAQLHTAICALAIPPPRAAAPRPRRRRHVTGTSSDSLRELTEPNVNRSHAEIESIPTVPRARPSATITKAVRIDHPTGGEAQDSPSVIAKYSGGPNWMATSASQPAASMIPTTPEGPATNDPTAEMVRRRPLAPSWSSGSRRAG